MIASQLRQSEFGADKQSGKHPGVGGHSHRHGPKLNFHLMTSNGKQPSSAPLPNVTVHMRVLGREEHLESMTTVRGPTPPPPRKSILHTNALHVHCTSPRCISLKKEEWLSQRMSFLGQFIQSSLHSRNGATGWESCACTSKHRLGSLEHCALR